MISRRAAPRGVAPAAKGRHPGRRWNLGAGGDYAETGPSSRRSADRGDLPPLGRPALRAPPAVSASDRVDHEDRDMNSELPEAADQPLRLEAWKRRRASHGDEDRLVRT